MSDIVVSVIMFRVIAVSLITPQWYCGKCHYAQGHFVSVIGESGTLMSAITLSVILVSVNVVNVTGVSVILLSIIVVSVITFCVIVVNANWQ